MYQKTNKSNKHLMKNAYIENVIMWMVIFTGFAWMLFFVIDYASIIRVNDNMNALADYSANRVGKDGSIVTSDANFIQDLNDMKVPTINTITSDNITCNTVVDGAYQMIFLIQTTNTEYKFYKGGKLASKRVVFNDTGTTDTISCTLTITLSN